MPPFPRGSSNTDNAGWEYQTIDDATRVAISRVSNIIRVLTAHFVPLSDTILLEAYEWVVEQESDVRDVLSDELGENLVASLGVGIRQ